jgi:hypothetical protein
MSDVENPSSQPSPALHAASGASQSENLQQIGDAVDNARRPAPGQVGSVQFLVALAMLRQLREHIGAWEPELIDAARATALD